MYINTRKLIFIKISASFRFLPQTKTNNVDKLPQTKKKQGHVLAVAVLKGRDVMSFDMI